MTAAGAISFLPATGAYHGWNTSILSGPRAGTSVAQRDGFIIQQRTVSGDVFSALEIPVLAGRTFDARDDGRAPSRAVVSANFARTAFPGSRLMPSSGSVFRPAAAHPSRSLASSATSCSTRTERSTLAVYHPHRQFANNRNWVLSHVVSTQRPPETILADVRATVAALDPELVVHRAAPLGDVVGRGTSRERFALVLMTAFAGVSLLLATLGLYGVLAYAVGQRTQEIGIRMALGATAAEIRLTVLRQASVVLGAGLLAGTLGALVLGRWLTSLAFEISPSDPRILLAAAVLLAIMGLFAAWLPGASRIESGTEIVADDIGSVA